MTEGVELRASEGGVILGGPGFPVADGQVMVFDAASGKWFPGDLPTPGATSIAQAWAVDESSTFATNGTENFRLVTTVGGANFAENLNTFASLVFDPVDCSFTNAGADPLLLDVRCLAVVENAVAGQYFGSLVIDVNNDMNGQTSNTGTTVNGQMQEEFLAGTPSMLFVTERTFSLPAGQKFGPAYGATGPVGADSPIDRLLLTVRLAA